MSNTSIEWTKKVWNPTTGCTKISAGCKYCYAERYAIRHQNNPNIDRYKNGFKLTTHTNVLNDPYNWKKPSEIFVNSMSDLFHEDVDLSFIKEVFHVMNNTPRHKYKVLTKRSDRLLKCDPHLPWSENVLMGVTVEDNEHMYRIDDLRKTSAHLKFLSIEPLLEPLDDLDLSGIDWVIVGGESGPQYRRVHSEWVRDIRDKCDELKIPFFFKQWGGKSPKKYGHLLDGKVYQQKPY